MFKNRIFTVLVLSAAYCVVMASNAYSDEKDYAFADAKFYAGYGMGSKMILVFEEYCAEGVENGSGGFESLGISLDILSGFSQYYSSGDEDSKGMGDSFKSKFLESNGSGSGNFEPNLDFRKYPKITFTGKKFLNHKKNSTQSAEGHLFINGKNLKATVDILTEGVTHYAKGAFCFDFGMQELIGNSEAQRKMIAGSEYSSYPEAWCSEKDGTLWIEFVIPIRGTQT